MTNIKHTVFKQCPVHPEEPIIRASLDIKCPKLLYCQECLESVEGNVQAGLYRFSHVGNKIYEQLSKKYEEYQQSLPNTSSKEYKAKIEGFISQQKAKADEEFAKIQSQILEVLAVSKNEVYTTLDKIRTNLLADYEASADKVNNFPDPALFEGKDVTKDEIYHEIEGNEDSVEQIEKRIRARLEIMKKLDEIKEETMIGLSRHEKLKFFDTMPLTNSKDSTFYKDGLKGLDAYFQALVFDKDNGKEEQKVSETLVGQTNLLEMLNQSVEACQASLEKTNSRVAAYVEGMVGLYYSDPVAAECNAVTESTNMNSNRNVYYDDRNSSELSEKEGKFYEDGYFDYEDEF